jgi:siroheme synthase-like protein
MGTPAAGLPVVLAGEGLRALVVGGGVVAERKVRALLDAGACVRVVAPGIADGLRRAAASCDRLVLLEREWAAGDVDDAQLVVAATDVRGVNAAVAAEARRAGRLVNVVDRPDEGNFVTAAVHRAGDVTIAVTTGGVPAAAARIRDAIAERVDGRYARAVSLVGELRARLLRERGAEAWREASAALVGEDFCEAVEAGTLEERVRRWA